MVPFLAIGAFAGLRSAEIERLDWSEVHLAEKFIEIKAAKAKTASRRIVPISSNLAKWLKDHAKDEGRVVPFDNVNKQIGWLVEDTNSALKAAAEKDGKDPEKAKKVKWKKNALRHSFISYRVAETQDVAKVALEAGNSPQIIFQHYRELVHLDTVLTMGGETVPHRQKGCKKPVIKKAAKPLATLADVEREVVAEYRELGRRQLEVRLQQLADETGEVSPPAAAQTPEVDAPHGTGAGPIDR